MDSPPTVRDGWLVVKDIGTIIRRIHTSLRRDRADGPWEHGVGADWEQLCALNIPEQSSMDLN